MQNSRAILGAIGVALIGGGVALSGQVHADTLESVLANTYQTNPEVLSERAKLRAIDETVPQARSGYRPRLNFNADISASSTRTKPKNPTGPTQHTHLKTGGYSVDLVQPIFRGLRTINSIREADATVYAGREALRAVEQDVFLRTSTAYMDVIRDRSIVRLRSNNITVLAEQMQATKDRFSVGEVTKTDLAQAEARHSRAISDLNFAKASLRTSEAVFEQMAGRKARRLRKPRSITKFIPRSLNGSLDRGLKEHPTILASAYLEMAAIHAKNRIRGELLPEVNLTGKLESRRHPSATVKARTTATIAGTFRVPLYEGGEVYARIRQAKQTILQRRQELETARKLVRANVVAGWGQLVSIRAKLKADRAQVSATKTALDGVREEEKVGQRTVLDVLDAQQEYLNARVDLRTSQRDLVVARYNLLAATGRLTALELGLKVDHYLPEDHYNRVERKWIGSRVEEYNRDEFEGRHMTNDRYFPAAFKK